MYPCDICGEGWPIQLMHELADRRIVCENCIMDIETKKSEDKLVTLSIYPDKLRFL